MMFYKLSEKSKISSLIVYVDDIILIWDNSKKLADLKGMLAKDFKIKDLGFLKYFFGM